MGLNKFASRTTDSLAKGAYPRFSFGGALGSGSSTVNSQVFIHVHIHTYLPTHVHIIYNN